MSRSGYNDNCDHYELWRQAVSRALNGKRGQAFLRELLRELDELPEKQLAAGGLVRSEGFCAMGVVAVARDLDVEDIDDGANDGDQREVAYALGISEAMAKEIADVNDEGPDTETPEERFVRVREWALSKIRGEP